MKEMKLNVLIHKKLTGEISAEELLHLDALLVADVDNVEEEISSIWDMSNNYEPQVSFMADNAFGSLMDRINADIEESVVEEEILPKESKIIKLSPNQADIHTVKPVRAASMFSLRNIARIAAVFIFGLTAYMTYDTVNGDVYTSGASTSYAMLDDGTSVWLAPNSSLKYESSIGSDRKVTLEGKAFFDVKRDEARPFSITSDKVTITVLGTSFTVDSYTGQVSVNSGKVAVNSENDESIITKGQKVSLEGDKLSLTSTDKSDFKWINKNLKFDNTPLDQVIKELSIYYGVDISYKGRTDITQCPFTATDLTDATLNQVLTILQATYDMEISRDDENTKVRLSKVRCR